MLQPRMLLIEIPGAILVAAGFVGFWLGAIPEVAPPTVSGDMQPLAVPFVVTNKSSLLNFQHVQTTCRGDQAKWANASGMIMPDGLSVSHPQGLGTLEVGISAQVNCNLILSMRDWTKFHMTGDLDSIRIQIIATYRLLYLIPKTWESSHFCWAPTPPSGHQWSVCDAL
jgi:hypothetical protein